MTITVSKLDKPYRDGDFKDPPFKWTVKGPGNEVQNFATKAWATRYASIRRRSNTASEAGKAFVLASL